MSKKEIGKDIDLEHFDYMNELKIDHNALDVEWFDQPALFMKYARASVQTRTDLDLAKQKLEVVKANVETDVRRNPSAYIGSDSKKLTESFIQAVVCTHDDVQQAEEVVIEARHLCDLFAMMVKAFDQRKYALQMAVTLFGQKYFAGPIEPRDLDVAFENKILKSKVQSRIAGKLNKKTTE